MKKKVIRLYKSKLVKWKMNQALHQIVKDQIRTSYKWKKYKRSVKIKKNQISNKKIITLHKKVKLKKYKNNLINKIQTNYK